MVFGLIGGLRHLMWFVHASVPANLGECSLKSENGVKCKHYMDH